jgi:uncharacterized membrane protein YdbT with pleckstrin-like domain
MGGGKRCQERKSMKADIFELKTSSRDACKREKSGFKRERQNATGAREADWEVLDKYDRSIKAIQLYKASHFRQVMFDAILSGVSNE